MREPIESFEAYNPGIRVNVCLESEVRKLEADYAELEKQNKEMALSLRQYEELLNALKP